MRYVTKACEYPVGWMWDAVEEATGRIVTVTICGACGNLEAVTFSDLEPRSLER